MTTPDRTPDARRRFAQNAAAPGQIKSYSAHPRDAAGENGPIANGPLLDLVCTTN
jgi:hypothetical protein